MSSAYLTNKAITSWHQQVFALDAKFNSQRVPGDSRFGMLLE